MKTLVVLLATCGLGWLVTAHAQNPAPAPSPQPEPVKTDLDKLQGKWQCTSWVRDGVDGTRNPEDVQSTYEGNRLTLWDQGQEYRHALVTLDPSRTPKAMNTWDSDGPGEDETNKGIYALDGDTLKLCIVLGQGHPRPTEFTSKPGSNRLLLTYKRQKP